MEDLKNAFEAARSFEGDTLEQAGKKMGVSRTFLNHFFRGVSTSEPLRKKVRAYIKDSGLYEHIEDLGLNPESTKNDLTGEPALDPQHT